MKKVKFAVLIAVVLGSLAWIGATAVTGNQSYYKTVAEMQTLPDNARAKKLRVAGDIQAGSIKKKTGEVDFTLIQEHKTLTVAYTGEDPLPDTFRDGAQALAEGHLGTDGIFRASHVDAKCSSKYEAKPGMAPEGLQPKKQASL